MAFSLFTKRTESTSRWLRFTARALQTCGILGGLVSLCALGFIAIAQSDHPAASGNADHFLRNRIIWIFGECLSLYFIGHALLRRQKWAAYVALGTIALPAVVSQVSLTRRGLHYPPLLTVLPLVTVALVASVWRELGSVRDSDIVDYGSPPEPIEPLTQRKQGYGEPSGLPTETAPEAVAVAKRDAADQQNAR